MSEELMASAGGDGTDASHADEFYIRRINWLITLGRHDLIDEIADDCERRRTAPHTAADLSRAPEAATKCPAREPLLDLQDLADDTTANQPGARHNVPHNASAAPPPSFAVHHGPSTQSEPRIAAGLPPKPVATGTRLAVATLRRSLRPASRIRPE
jgi:hypothetical protein